MTVIDLDDLPKQARDALDARAKKNARSIADEAKAILAEVVKEPSAGLGDQMRAVFVSHGALVDDFPLPEREIYDPPLFE